MTRPEDEKVARIMKEAASGDIYDPETAKNIINSWGAQRPGASLEGTFNSLRLFAERKPEMIHTFAGNQLAQVVERGILDKKTRPLVTLGVYMAQRHWDGIGAQVCNARAAGATDEEIMEVAFIADYGASKTWLVEICQALGKAFESDNYKNTKIAE